MAKVFGPSLLWDTLKSDGTGDEERLRRNFKEAQAATEVCVKFEACPNCGHDEFNHIRSKVHCGRCHVTIETCCD